MAFRISYAVLPTLFIATVLPTHAAEVEVSTFSHAAANCQSALPVYDGVIRKRPKAVANEGTTDAFVTCAFEQLPDLPGKVVSVRVYAVNREDFPRPITCTLVDGFGDAVYSPALTKLFNMQFEGSLTWNAGSDNQGVNYTAPALSCKLNPGVELAGTRLTFLTEIGD
jgi:hypothetical protein